MYLGNTAILIELNDAVSFLDCFPIGQFIKINHWPSNESRMKNGKTYQQLEYC